MPRLDRAEAGVERVFVELDWYDGPRAGVAAVGGAPHYFRAVRDYVHGDDEDDTFAVWPANEQALAWELEQWAIFVAWNKRYEAGMAGTDSHPAHGGVDPRYDELNELLEPCRAVPHGARRLRAVWQPRRHGGVGRHHEDGPSYGVRWHPE